MSNQLTLLSLEHFTRYFKLTEDEADDPEWIFDWGSLKAMHKSFLDSIVVELCLPNSQYSKQIMLQLLEEATTESPKETKRFPQALWDAVGDFSASIPILVIHTNVLMMRTVYRSRCKCLPL